MSIFTKKNVDSASRFRSKLLLNHCVYDACTQLSNSPHYAHKLQILETPMHFSGPAPKFKNLKKFAKDFIQPKLGLYLVFVERCYEPIAWAKRQEIGTLSSRSNFFSYYLVHVLSPGRHVFLYVRRLSLYKTPAQFSLQS